MNQFVLPFRAGNLSPGEDPGDQIGGDHPDIPVDGNMSRWEFGQVDVERLTIPIAIQYDGHHTWDFEPSKEERPGVPNWSRWQFIQARIQEIPSDLDVTFAGEKFGEVREVAQPPDTDGVPDWVKRPLAFLEAAKGGKYTAWKPVMGEFEDGPPAWVSNAKPPPAAAVKSKGGFCASLPNLACRVNDIDIFVDSPKWWAGGVPWWGEHVLSKKVARKFVLNRQYPPGALFLRRYTGPALANQGHVAILLRGRTLIQSDLQLGINSSRTLESTHNGLCKFEYYILPDDWLRPKGGS